MNVSQRRALPARVLRIFVTLFGSLLALSALAQPTVSSPTQTGITMNGATLGGDVTASSSAITARGIVFSLSSVNADPQLGGNGVRTALAGEASTGVFTVNVTQLTPGGIYTFKAYATNEEGTGYSAADTFAVEGATGSVGDGIPVQNMQPTLALTWMIKVSGGIYPMADGDPQMEAYLGEIRLMPFGSNAMQAGSGWAPCEGQILPINANQALFTLLGTTYGGNGISTFALPDLRGRIPVGMGNGWTLGSTGGQETTQLTTANIAGHAHSYATGTTLRGTSTPIDNLQPYLVLNLCVVGASGNFIEGTSWVRIFAFNTIPSGMLPCDGRLLSISNNTALFSRLGTYYGGDGMSTFGVPNLVGRTLVGSGESARGVYSAGETFGEETFTLIESELPVHVHSYSGGNTGVAGGSQPHSTVQPSLVMNAMISPFGVYGQSSDQQAVGEIRFMAGSTFLMTDYGWLPANGQGVPIAEYDTLFNLIGTTFGGDGNETFALPDLVGRTALHVGQGPGLTNRQLGEEIGAAEVTLTVNQLPAHTHLFNINPELRLNLTQSITVAEDGVGQAITSFLDATDPDLNQTLTWTVSASPTRGVISPASTSVATQGNANSLLPSSMTYTPSLNQNGADTFTILVSDGSATDALQFNVTITEVNDAPTGENDSLDSVAEDSGARTISFASLLSNDSKGPANESGQSLTITSVDNAIGGTVSLSGTDVLFTPAANFNGTASFTYTLQDNGTTNGISDPKTSTATVDFTVTAVNDAPAVNANTGAPVDFGSNAAITSAQLHYDDVEQADDAIVYTLTSAVTNGTLFRDGSELALEGTFTQADIGAGLITFTHDGSATTTASFGFSVSDGAGGSAAGQTFTFEITAIAPAAPTIGTATPGDSQASVSFTTPTSNGGAAITGYTVTSNPGGISATGAASPIVVSGLTNGVSYSFNVTATNSAGTSGESAASSVVTPKANQTISFASLSNFYYGDSWQLTATATSGLPVTFTTSTPDFATIDERGVVSFIAVGTAKIHANQAGNATFAAAPTVSYDVSIGALAPDAPTDVEAESGNAQASVSFTPPSDNGGAEITLYTVTADSGGITAMGTSSPIVITGLTNGTSYTFTVSATNSAGESSPSSPSNSIVPQASQTIVFNNPGTQNFGTSPTLTATATSGLPVTFTSSTPEVATITTDGVLTLVAPGTATITANQAGDDGHKAALAVTQSFTVAAVVPGAPTSVSAVASDSQATVSFTAPTFAGGADIILYTVASDPGAFVASGSASPIVVTGLTNGSQYSFTVTATNAVGTGPLSVPSAPITISESPAVLSIERASANPTRASSVEFTVTFSEQVSGVSAEDFMLTSTGTADGAVGSVSSSDSIVYTVTTTGLSGDGTLRLDLKSSGTAIVNTVNTPIATGFTGGESYTIDTTAPQVESIERLNPLTVATDATVLTWRVTFDAGVTGVDPTDFALSGGPTGTVSSVTQFDSGAFIYDVEVNDLEGQGRVQLDLNASGTGIADLAGNEISGGFSEGDFYLAGVTNVFDATAASNHTTFNTVTSTLSVAQRFTTGAEPPLSLTKVAALLGNVTGSDLKVQIFTSETVGPDEIVGELVADLTLDGVLSAHALNVWSGSNTLQPGTTYWIVFSAVSGAFDVAATSDVDHGEGEWLLGNYIYRYGPEMEFEQPGALHIAIGAKSTPVVNSTLSTNGTYKTAFTYTITATNEPTSFGAANLPAGLTLNAATGVISGAAAATGTFNIGLTATNPSGTSEIAVLTLVIEKAPLTVTPVPVARTYGTANPTFALAYDALLGGDTSAALTTAPAATTLANAGSPVGTYTITAAGGVSDHYAFTYLPGVLTVTPASQTISFGALSNLTIGQSASLNASASSGLPVSFSILSGPATLNGSNLTTIGIGTVTVRASQSGSGNYSAATSVTRSFEVKVGAPPVSTTPDQVPVPPVGGTVELNVGETNSNVSYQWQRNGTDVTGASGATLTLNDVGPPTAGLYTYTATGSDGSQGSSEPVIVGLTTDEPVVGTGEVVDSDVVHPNGNIYDQVLLEGPGASVTASPKKVTRISFIDLSDDIVQVEFTGPGTLSLTMDNASMPATAVNYDQPEVAYVKGHAGIVITGADETSHVSVFTVGRITAVNQQLFVDDVVYDGVANISFIAIQSSNGKFGGIRAGNVHFFASSGFTGIYAPGVDVTGPINIGDIAAYDSATPLLVFGTALSANITGGSLLQPNGQPVKVSGLGELRFIDGTTSQGAPLPAQPNEGVLEEDGVIVTDELVVNP